MREINFSKIVETVAKMCVSANNAPAEGIEACYEKALNLETTEPALSILKDCIENCRIAHDERIPLCQDTGLAVFFVKIGADVRITGGSLYDAVSNGVSRRYKEG